MDAKEFPDNSQRPPWLTDEYITDILRKAEEDPEIIVNNSDFNLPLGKGENYTSVILKVKVSYINGKGHQQHKTFIMKVIPQSVVMQYFLKESNLFHHEIKVYRELFPAMERVTDKPLVSAKFYPTDREDILILEDMSSRGFKMADRKKRLDLAHSFLVLETLARFHGLSFGVVERDPNIVDLFPETMYSDRMQEINSGYYPNMFNSLASVVETWPGFERFGEKIRRRVDGLVDNIKEIISPKKTSFNVFNHGDCWVNNMLFRYNEDTQEPEEVCFLDLQTVRYGSPALDLQYFFATSLEDGIREEHEDALLEAYHKELCKTLRSVTLQPITYSLEDLKNDFQEKAAFGFDMGCWIIGVVVADTSDAFDYNDLPEDCLVDGSANQMEMGKMYHGKNFKSVFQKFLLYFEGKKAI